MKAVRLHGYGEADQLVYEDAPNPAPKPGEVLVKVAAGSLNPFEVFARRGYVHSFMPLTFPAILGMDVAGTVASLGDGVTEFKVGDRVFGSVPFNGAGSNAEFVAAPATVFARLPDAVSFEKAATLPLAGSTGIRAVTDFLKPNRGDRVLVNGALGATGRAAVFALKQAGAVPVAAVKTGREADAKVLGVEAIVLDDATRAKYANAFAGAIDTVGGQAASDLIPLIRDGGTLAAVAGAGESAPGLERVKVVNVQGGATPETLATLAGAVVGGKLDIPIGKTLPLAEVAEGHRLYEAGGVRGKIVFVP